jgi:reverse gyrase
MSEVSKCADAVPLEEMYEMSLQMAQDCEDYRHCELQAAIAGIIASYNKPFVIAVSPTGSGKTWIQGLLAKYHCIKGKRVTVVEPNEMLHAQTAAKLVQVDYAINVVTVEQYLREP